MLPGRRPRTRDRVGPDPARGGARLGCFGRDHTAAGEASGSEPPPPTPRAITPHGWERTMLLVLWISFRDKRQQKGFERGNSGIALYAPPSGYWFKYETCTPQEKQTNTDFSCFLF